MAEIRLKKRYKYAGDIMPKLLDIGFDIETANGFLNSIKDADVAPRAEVDRVARELERVENLYFAKDTQLENAKAEVAREIFEEIEDVINGIGYFDELDLKVLKNKYAEVQK